MINTDLTMKGKEVVNIQLLLDVQNEHINKPFYGKKQKHSEHLSCRKRNLLLTTQVCEKGLQT